MAEPFTRFALTQEGAKAALEDFARNWEGKYS